MLQQFRNANCDNLKEKNCQSLLAKVSDVWASWAQFPLLAKPPALPGTTCISSKFSVLFETNLNFYRNNNLIAILFTSRMYAPTLPW